MLFPVPSVRVLVPGALVALLATGAVVMWPQTAPAPAPAKPPAAPAAAPAQTAPAKPQDAPKPPDGGPPQGGQGQHHWGRDNGQPHQPPAPGAPPDLGDVMKGLKGDLQALDTAVTAKKTDDAITAVSDMERLVLTRRSASPRTWPTSPRPTARRRSSPSARTCCRC